MGLFGNKQNDANKAQEEAIKANKQFDEKRTNYSDVNKAQNEAKWMNRAYDVKSAAVRGAGVVAGAAAGAGEFSSSAVKKIKNFNPGRYNLAFILAVLNYAVKYLSGFEINTLSISLDFITMLVFLWAGIDFVSLFFFDSALVPILLTVFVPFVSVYLSSTIVNYLIWIPWWVVFGVYWKFKYGISSSVVNITVAVGGLIALIMMAPAGYTSFSTQEYGLNQAWIDSAVEQFNTGYTNTINNAKYWKCTNIEMSTASDCKKKIYGSTDEDLVALANIETVSGSGFTMSIDEFINSDSSEDLIYGDSIPIKMSFSNYMTSEANVLFSCNMEELQGKMSKESATIPIKAKNYGLNLKCSDLKVNKTKKVNFNFTANATNLVATGDKTILVISQDVKDAVLERYEGTNENRVLLMSKEFGTYLKAQQSELATRVGADDSLQPIILVGNIQSTTSVAPLLNGVGDGTTIPLRLFIKNNGKGKITKINSIVFNLPNGMSFDSANCGISGSTYSKSWDKIASGKIASVAICELKMDSTQYPNNIDPNEISVTVNYEYMITKSSQITIAAEASN